MQYAFRAEWQSIDPWSKCILFCTFTYSPESLPLDNELSKKVVQDYIRRLRLRIAPLNVKYMFCGEYGEDERYTKRAHYHAILWFDGFPDYHHIVDAWPFGIVSILPYTNARGGYVAKYSQKQIGGNYEGHLQMPFIMVSNGLGFYFLDKHGDYCRKHFITSWENVSGYPVYLPRVFLERIFPPQDRLHLDYTLQSGAASVYYWKFAGDVTEMRRRHRVDYDHNLELKTCLSGCADSLQYEGLQRIGNSFRHSNRMRSILNRVSYETGRYC